MLPLPNCAVGAPAIKNRSASPVASTKASASRVSRPDLWTISTLCRRLPLRLHAAEHGAVKHLHALGKQQRFGINSKGIGIEIRFKALSLPCFQGALLQPGGGRFPSPRRGGWKAAAALRQPKSLPAAPVRRRSANKWSPARRLPGRPADTAASSSSTLRAPGAPGRQRRRDARHAAARNDDVILHDTFSSLCDAHKIPIVFHGHGPVSIIRKSAAK